MSVSLLFESPHLIHAYGCTDALADGVLVDVSPLAREAGFRVPVAVTATVWRDCVAWDQTREVGLQDELGRLWDLLSMARMAARAQPGGNRTFFSILRVASGQLRPSRVRLLLVLGPDDEGAPAITIMQPTEV